MGLEEDAEQDDAVAAPLQRQVSAVGAGEGAVSPRPPKAETLAPAPAIEPETRVPAPIEDDRERLRQGDRVLLIIEDDSKFARIMVAMARERGFKAVVASRGDTGLALANELQPAAITLDIQLPVVDGWSILDRLKRNPRTRHIPVHVISIVEKTKKGAAMGAFAYLEKPVSKEALEGAFTHISSFLEKKVKRLLVIEDDLVQQKVVSELVQGEDVQVTAATSAAEAERALEADAIDCVVLDLMLEDEDAGGRLLEKIKTQPRFKNLPVVVYTGKELAKR